VEVPNIANKISTLSQALGLHSVELLESHFQSLTNEELEDSAAQLTKRTKRQ
jgi:hypothetical protein